MKREHTRQYYLTRLEVEKTSSRDNCKKQITNTLKVWANCKGEMKAKCINVVTDLQDNTLVTKYFKYYYLGLTSRLMYYIYFNNIENLATEELKYLYNEIKNQQVKVQML